MAVPPDSDRLDQFEEGNAAGSDAGEVAGVPYPSVPTSMTSGHFPDPGALTALATLDAQLHLWHR
jgi:hypothetical protein